MNNSNDYNNADAPQTEEALTKALIEKEAQIAKTEKEIKTNKKEIKNIEKSNTWKYSEPVRKMNDLFAAGKRSTDQSQYIKQLEAELETAEKERDQAKERMHELMLDDRKLNSQALVKKINETKLDGGIIDFIDKTVKNKKQHDTNYRNALSYAARLYMNEENDYKNMVYSKALEGLKIEEIPEFMMRAGLSEDPIPLRQAASFRGSLNMRIRQMQLTGTLPEWLLDDKQAAYQFMDHLGVRIPKISKQTYRLEEIPREGGIVIKPVDGAGGRGVYLVYSNNDIIDIKRSKKMHSWEELISSMKEDVLMGWVHHNEWFTEELILEDIQKKTPASDIKFYCFYGKVGIILEITRVPELRYCWWTITGERVRTGKYDEDLFKGQGVTQSEIEFASDISLKIPAPFIRIDFLRSENGLIFGEFTPKPGNYDDFDEKTDKWLGDYFIEAQGRLSNDLLNGKDFSAFKQFTPRNKYNGDGSI
ncbi:ATP-grasp fold amidoligase family protein [Virgibacillus sp. YIM 98842]|uniref:ATP-grasp fold amidoligase family protein n=1 Tax=Virgibacillus sp. YIM 98842 TaxID=2663533 RepID=UPI0013DCE037|nr:ATP-grasp fold amidoligase family protein [Virgibacillus sp. YIM 98842]